MSILNRRTASIFIAGIIPALLFFALVDKIPTILSSRVQALTPWAIHAISIILEFIAFSAIIWIADYRPKHFLRTAHMPAPVAGIIGGGLFCGLYTHSPLYGAITLGVSSATFLLATIAISNLQPQSESKNASISFDEFPIASSNDDLYNFSDRAKALANRLQSGCGPILIIGRYGSGKSSLGNLIFNELNSQKNTVGTIDTIARKWIKVSVSGWGLQDPEARAKEILGSVCERLQSEVDTIALKEHCHSFLRGAFGDIHWTTKILFGLQRHSINEISTQMDHLLKISDLRVLLILDDFERNARIPGGPHDWNCGVSEIIEHLKQAQYIKIIACVTKESTL